MISEITQEVLDKHAKWLRDEEGGERLVTVAGLVTISADLSGANLRGANLDYSCLPLWCGSKGMIVDARIAAQIAAHLCALTCDDPDFLEAREALLPFAKTSHRAAWLLED